jgi:hypothetical protein
MRGYFIKACGIIGLYDKSWISRKNIKYMIEALIADVSNHDVLEKRFPRFRQFDHFEGHHYASGHAGFGSGNNQESSSEAMNFNTAVILWGEVSENKDLRDMGLYLYASEAVSIEQYWFNNDKKNFPEVYTKAFSSLLWDDGGGTQIFWGPPHPEEILGINLLPVNSFSSYLFRYNGPNIYRSFLQMNNQKNPEVWADIIWKWMSLFDPTEAYNRLSSDLNLPIESGTSLAYDLYFIQFMKHYGIPETNITANYPYFMVFQGGLHVCYNPSNKKVKIRFSDGISFMVNPGSYGFYLPRQTSPTNERVTVYNYITKTVYISPRTLSTPVLREVTDFQNNKSLKINSIQSIRNICSSSTKNIRLSNEVTANGTSSIWEMKCAVMRNNKKRRHKRVHDAQDVQPTIKGRRNRGNSRK